MELLGGMLRALLSGPRRRGGTLGLAFSSWRPHLPQAGLSATELVSQWTAVFEKGGIPEARESSEYIVAHVLGAKTVKCSGVQSGSQSTLGRGGGGRRALGEGTSRLLCPMRVLI